MMEETRELAISALREEFAKIINGITEKLNKDSAKPKVIKSSMFNKMREFLDGFGTRNIFEDPVLVELSQQARDLIDGVSPSGIKKNDVMRQKIKNEMNELKSAIDAAISTYLSHMKIQSLNLNNNFFLLYFLDHSICKGVSQKIKKWK